MARFAIIDAGRVTNIIEAEQDFAETIGAVPAGSAGIGWMWDGTDFVEPPPQPIPVPQTLTIRQAKLILLQNNLLDDVDAAVSQADRSTQIEWEYATEVHRTWPTLITMASALGMTDAQLDQLFIEGAKL